MTPLLFLLLLPLPSLSLPSSLTIIKTIPLLSSSYCSQSTNISIQCASRSLNGSVPCTLAVPPTTACHVVLEGIKEIYENGAEIAGIRVKTQSVGGDSECSRVEVLARGSPAASYTSLLAAECPPMGSDAAWVELDLSEAPQVVYALDVITHGPSTTSGTLHLAQVEVYAPANTPAPPPITVPPSLVQYPLDGYLSHPWCRNAASPSWMCAERTHDGAVSSGCTSPEAVPSGDYCVMTYGELPAQGITVSAVRVHGVAGTAPGACPVAEVQYRPTAEDPLQRIAAPFVCNEDTWYVVDLSDAPVTAVELALVILADDTTPVALTFAEFEVYGPADTTPPPPAPFPGTYTQYDLDSWMGFPWCSIQAGAPSWLCGELVHDGNISTSCASELAMPAGEQCQMVYSEAPSGGVLLSGVRFRGAPYTNGAGCPVYYVNYQDAAGVWSGLKVPNGCSEDAWYTIDVSAEPVRVYGLVFGIYADDATPLRLEFHEVEAYGPPGAAAAPVDPFPGSYTLYNIDSWMSRPYCTQGDAMSWQCAEQVHDGSIGTLCTSPQPMAPGEYCQVAYRQLPPAGVLLSGVRFRGASYTGTTGCPLITVSYFMENGTSERLRMPNGCNEDRWFVFDVTESPILVHGLVVTMSADDTESLLLPFIEMEVYGPAGATPAPALPTLPGAYTKYDIDPWMSFPWCSDEKRPSWQCAERVHDGDPDTHCASPELMPPGTYCTMPYYNAPAEGILMAGVRFRSVPYHTANTTGCPVYEVLWKRCDGTLARFGMPNRCEDVDGWLHIELVDEPILVYGFHVAIFADMNTPMYLEFAEVEAYGPVGSPALPPPSLPDNLIPYNMSEWISYPWCRNAVAPNLECARKFIDGDVDTACVTPDPVPVGEFCTLSFWNTPEVGVDVYGLRFRGAPEVNGTGCTVYEFVYKTAEGAYTRLQYPDACGQAEWYYLDTSRAPIRAYGFYVAVFAHDTVPVKLAYTEVEVFGPPDGTLAPTPVPAPTPPCGPTPSPTNAPTPMPTMAPTASPVAEPMPTMAPTASPVTEPMPTTAPTQDPTGGEGEGGSGNGNGNGEGEGEGEGDGSGSGSGGGTSGDAVATVPPLSDLTRTGATVAPGVEAVFDTGCWVANGVVTIAPALMAGLLDVPCGDAFFNVTVQLGTLAKRQETAMTTGSTGIAFGQDIWVGVSISRDMLLRAVHVTGASESDTVYIDGVAPSEPSRVVLTLQQESWTAASDAEEMATRANVYTVRGGSPNEVVVYTLSFVYAAGEIDPSMVEERAGDGFGEEVDWWWFLLAALCCLCYCFALCCFATRRQRQRKPLLVEEQLVGAPMHHQPGSVGGSPRNASKLANSGRAAGTLRVSGKGASHLTHSRRASHASGRIPKGNNAGANRKPRGATSLGVVAPVVPSDVGSTPTGHNRAAPVPPTLAIPMVAAPGQRTLRRGDEALTSRRTGHHVISAPPTLRVSGMASSTTSVGTEPELARPATRMSPPPAQGHTGSSTKSLARSRRQSAPGLGVPGHALGASVRSSSRRRKSSVGASRAMGASHRGRKPRSLRGSSRNVASSVGHAGPLSVPTSARVKSQVAQCWSTVPAATKTAVAAPLDAGVRSNLARDVVARMESVWRATVLALASTPAHFADLDTAWESGKDGGIVGKLTTVVDRATIKGITLATVDDAATSAIATVVTEVSALWKVEVPEETVRSWVSQLVPSLVTALMEQAQAQASPQ